MRDPKERFSDRVGDYARWRPGYPVEVVRLLEREAGILPARTRVCDVGAGTGISAELFLREGYAVTAVEPNDAMRREMERRLSESPRLRAVRGAAEATTLPDASVDLVVAAQAFHWFDRERARAEWRRILSPGGLVALVWNDRRVDTPFLRAYEEALLRWGTDYAKVRHQSVDDAAVAAFFRGPHEKRRVPSHQDFDLEGLLGRARSSSYVPQPGEAGHDELFGALERLFDGHAEGGTVRFAYDTILYFGGLGG